MDELGNELDIIFEGIRGALEAFEDNDLRKALWMIKHIHPVIARLSIKHTNAEPGSPHYAQIVKVLMGYYGKDDTEGGES